MLGDKQMHTRFSIYKNVAEGVVAMSKKTDETQESILNLPKNIQQIGSAGNGIKVYLEDYSGTYIRRILNDDRKYHAILLGKKQTDNKQTYLFIQAVIEVEPEVKEPYWKYNWNHIYEVMQQYFIEEGKDKLEILGWAMPIDDYKKLDVNELEKMHRCNFDGNMTVAFLLDRQEMREQFYILENDRFHSLNGYYIYYEKNKAMQTYVLENQPGPCVETEDVVKGNRESYRTILQKRKDMMQKRQTLSMLYVASTFLVMVVVVLGITMMNNYEKMQEMQDVISRLSKSVLNEETQSVQAQNITGNALQPTPDSIPEDTAQAVQAMSQSIIQENTQPDVSTQPDEATAEPTETATPEPTQTLQPTEEPIKTTAPPATAKPEKTKQPTATPAANKPQKYKVQLGDTLLDISIKIYGTPGMVKKICEYNDIEDGDQIVEGDVLLLP